MRKLGKAAGIGLLVVCAGAPVFTFDTNCSQAIADLLDDGFQIHAARGDDQFLYTLIKERRGSSGK